MQGKGMGRRTFIQANAAALAMGIMPRRASRDQDPGAVSYLLRYDSDRAGRVVVTMTPPPQQGPVQLVFPRAIPMGYGVVPYADFVEGVRGWSPTGEHLPVARLEGPRWRIGRDGAAIERIRYVVDVHRMEQRTLSAADSSRSRYGYLSLLGYSVLGYLDGLEKAPIKLDVRAPVGWPVYATLSPSATPWPGQVTLNAPEFYAAADSQILMGPDLQVRQLAGVRPLYLVGYVEAPADLALDGSLVEQAFGRVSEWFAGTPFPHYTAMIEYLRPVSSDHQYGFSMEHLESSTYFLDTTRALLPTSPADALDRARFNYAHHIAHSWIPKRLAGEGYFPHRWEVPPVIDTLWFSEGFARWIASEALLSGTADGNRDSLRTEQRARWQGMVDQFPAVFRTTSLVDLSRVGSTQYSEDFRIGQTLYCRGALFACELDSAIRERAAGGRSLRDSIRAAMVWSAREKRGFRVDELPRLLGEPVGVDVGPVFAKWLA
jgi:predicted metalloprotease with PDZ domain